MAGAHRQAGLCVRLVLRRVQRSPAVRDPFSLFHTTTSFPGAGRILVQEGSTELGTGHEDTVGQKEVTEERLCRARTGEQEEASELRSTEHRYMHSWSSLLPVPRWAVSQQGPAPVTALCTQAKSTGMRTSCRPAKWTNPAPNDVIRVPGPLPDYADHPVSHRAGRVSLAPTCWVMSTGIRSHGLQQQFQDLLWGARHHCIPSRNSRFIALPTFRQTSRITSPLPMCQICPTVGLEGKLALGVHLIPGCPFPPPQEASEQGKTWQGEGEKPGIRKERRWAREKVCRRSVAGVLPVPAWGWGTRRASALRGSLQYQHHFAMFF